MPEKHEVNSRGQRPVKGTFQSDPERVAVLLGSTTQVEARFGTVRPFQNLEL